jgi:hypothetical protein
MAAQGGDVLATLLQDAGGSAETVSRSRKRHSRRDLETGSDQEFWSGARKASLPALSGIRG